MPFKIKTKLTTAIRLVRRRFRFTNKRFTTPPACATTPEHLTTLTRTTTLLPSPLNGFPPSHLCAGHLDTKPRTTAEPHIHNRLTKVPADDHPQEAPLSPVYIHIPKTRSVAQPARESDTSHSAYSQSTPENDSSTSNLAAASLPVVPVTGNILELRKELYTLSDLPLDGSAKSSFGRVYLAHRGNSTYAVKVILKSNISIVKSDLFIESHVQGADSDPINSKSKRKSLELCHVQHELRLLRALQGISPFLCGFLDACQDTRAVYILMVSLLPYIYAHGRCLLQPRYQPLEFDTSTTASVLRRRMSQAVSACVCTVYRRLIAHTA